MALVMGSMSFGLTRSIDGSPYIGSDIWGVCFIAGL